ncbi:MAG: SET domain-containing protein [Minisyncoccia bacterium]|jgi:SET domain-containing protein
MQIFPSFKIYCTDSKIENGGRGVFANEDIAKGEIIERCPVVVVKEEETSLLRKSELINYYFIWGEDKKAVAICLGFGSLYNHSYEPNATYEKLIDDDMIKFIAIKDIKKNEEITVNYNYGDPDDKKPLWIKSIKHA